MAYNENTWHDGDVITASGMNNMEGGIASNDQRIGDLSYLQTTAKANLVAAINEVAQSGGGGGGLSNSVKAALLQLASKVAYIDEDGQDYYDDLYNALYPGAELVSINADYTQSGAVYPTTSLEDLRNDLVVNAIYDNGSVVPVISYTLSGTLEEGTSTITVTYEGFTDTFDVTVSAVPTVSSISAVYTQSGTVYDTDSLDSLKADLVVTATYSDSSTETVPSADYTLSGTLTVGTATITVTYESKTTTFNVTVTEEQTYVTTDLIHRWDAIDNTSSGHNSSSAIWEDLVGDNDLNINGSALVWGTNYLDFPNASTSSTSNSFLKSTSNAETAGGKTVEVCFAPATSQSSVVMQAFGNGSDSFASGDGYGKICIFTDNTVNGRGVSSTTYPTGLSALTDVKSVVVSFSGNSAINKLYVNGVEKSVGSTSHSFKGQAAKIYVGGTAVNANGISYNFNGKIYAIRIYDKILTDAEVEQNYAVDLARFGLGA